MQDQPTSVTVDELRELLEYVRSFRPVQELPPVLERPEATVSIAVGVHRVDRAVLRELVADDPDAWDVEEVSRGLHERYFRAQLKGSRPQTGCGMAVYTATERVEAPVL